MKIFLTIAFFLFTYLNAGVKVEGMAYIASTKENAKKMAILDAKVKAVEKAIGTYIKSQSKMENFEIKYDVVEQKIEGYVSSYSLVNESVKDNIYKVVINAEVKKGKVSLDIDQITSMLNEKKNPKFIILVQGDEMLGSIFESELKEYFLRNKISLIDLNAINPYYKELLTSNDNNMKSYSSKKVGADYIVTLDIQRQNIVTQYKGESHKSVTLHVEANAINISNNQLLVAKSFPSKSSENRIIVQSALIMEATQIAEDFSKEFLIDVIDQFKESSYNGDTLVLEISNINNYKKAMEIAEYLQSITFDSKVFLKSFEKHTGFYDVTIQGGLDRLLDDIIMNNDTYPLDILGKSNNSCKIELRK